MTKVPQLATPLTKPLYLLEQKILAQQVKIECWLRQQWQIVDAPFYSSVDIRNSGFKVAPVDTNLFPAGFNNLNPDFLPLCIQAVQATLSKQFPNVESILLIPENHTRNTFYLENIATLHDILASAGFAIRLGSVASDLKLPSTLQTANDRTIILHEVTKKDRMLQSENFIPDLILLNNDLSGGYPAVLDDLEQTILPDLRLGWDNRLKSIHFENYRTVVEELSKLIDIDPWLINPLFRNCGEVDFMKGEGLDCLEYNAELLFRQIKKKYAEYGIAEEPFIIVKADAGSYGMGIMSVKSPAELQNLNRKQRSHMAKTKGKQTVSKVILQEGIYTFEKWDNNVAEPVVYMIGENVVGGFYRVNTKRSDTENLNSPGMHFEPLAFADTCQAPGQSTCEASQRRFYIYGVIARLAALASARELQQIKEPA